VNSHGAMLIAKKAAARLGRTAVLERTCTPSRFGTILEAMADRRGRSAGARG
jgi:hypothetical protein